MKKLVLTSILIVLVFATSSVHAQQKYPLGIGNVAVKVDYFRFTDSDMKNLDLENGVYVGVEAYVPFFHPNLYLGLESGWAGTSGDVNIVHPVFLVPVRVDLDADFVPIEFNAKYVFDLHPCLALDVGAGISANYFSINVDAPGLSRSEDDWLVGGQFFADLNYKMGQVFFGANVKYQITDDIRVGGIDTDTSASNFRVGGQVGFMF